MVELNFVGEIDSLSARQQEYLSDVLHNRGYVDNKVLIETVGKPGDNYIANVKRIIVEEKDGGTFQMIAKIAPSSEVVRVQVQPQMLFSNEGVMYKEVLPKFVELQKEAGVHTEDILRYAKCYGVMLDAPDEIILLEDLQVSEFIMLDRFKSLSNDCIKLNLKNFAILHSLSMSLKRQKPDLFDDFSQKLSDYYSAFGGAPEFLYYLQSIENDSIEILDKNEYKNAIRGSVSKMTETSKKLLKDENKLKYSVIIQGDGWTNNIMYKMKDEMPLEAIMIDYQISKLSNPVCDILYMIFNCTDYNTRRDHYHDWIDYYHVELSKSLANFGIKADFIFSRDQLDADLKRYSKLFFANSIMLSTLLVRKSEDAAKLMESMETEATNMEEAMSNVQISNLDDESVAKFKNRVEGLIDTFRELGYIV